MPIVEISGSGAGADVVGLRVAGGSSVVRGLVINGFHGSELSLEAVGGDRVEGNYIGTDATGTFAGGTGLFGISATSGSNVIGGTGPGTRNIVSGSNVNESLAGDGNVVEGDFIGTDALGSGLALASPLKLLQQLSGFHGNCDRKVLRGVELLPVPLPRELQDQGL